MRSSARHRVGRGRSLDSVVSPLKIENVSFAGIKVFVFPRLLSTFSIPECQCKLRNSSILYPTLCYFLQEPFFLLLKLNVRCIEISVSTVSTF